MHRYREVLCGIGGVPGTRSDTRNPSQPKGARPLPLNKSVHYGLTTARECGTVLDMTTTPNDTPARRAQAKAFDKAGNPEIQTAIQRGLEIAERKTADRLARVERDAERKIQEWLKRPRCKVCRQPMAVTGRDRHYGCDPHTIVGLACTCPKGCSEQVYGDGLVACDPDCEVCARAWGTLLP